MSSRRRKTKNKRKCDALVHRYLSCRSTRRSYLLYWAKQTKLEDVDDDSRNKAK